MLRKSALFACAGLLILAGCQSGATASTNAKVQHKVLQEGTSKRVVEKGDAVWAVYSGRLTNGSVFDSNTDAKTKLPYFFVVGEKMVIAGWDQGVVGMKVGEKRELTIPPELAYGSQGTPSIPANSTLIFELEVVGLSKSKEVNAYFMEDKKVGTGAEAVDGKMVEVHYVAKYLNGREFDNSRLRNKTVSFKLGIRAPTLKESKSVVGLEDGVRGMKVGGVRRLILPPNLMFGPVGNGTVSGNQMAEIEVELISIK